MLSKHECLALLKHFNPPNIVRHCIIVGNVAYYIANALKRRGFAVDVRLTHRAALLHDLDKKPSLEEKCIHGDLSYKILISRGYKKLAEAVKAHRLLTLLERKLTLEELIVNYADKRAGAEIVSLKERMAYGIKRYAKTEEDKMLMKKATQKLFDAEKTIFKEFITLPKFLENTYLLHNIP